MFVWFLNVLPTCVCECSIYGSELHSSYQHVVWSKELRCKTFETLHSSHMGIIKTVEHARTAVFWPNMQKDIITHLSSSCPCAEFKIKQKPEPLSHDVPMVAWHSLTLDNFEFKGTHYLLVYDRFS